MEAKDTVIDRRELSKMTKHILASNEWAGELLINYEIAKAQAEISFKAGRESRNAEIRELRIEVGSIAFEKGKKAGIRKVVGWQNIWLEGHCHNREHSPHTKFRRLCFDCRQAKLKEWGIE